MADDQLVRQILQHQASVYRFLCSLVGNSSDAEDLLQQTMLTLWQKRDDQTTEDILPWAFSIAKNHARNHVRKTARRGDTHGLSEETLERIAAVREKRLDSTNRRSQALDHCLDHLPTEQQALVSDFYERRQTPEQIAQKQSKSVDSVYKSLQRIRRRLFECINTQLAPGGKS